MPATKKQNRSQETTLDLACTRCRERKIRCGRERPQCRNCERDSGQTCVYQNPAKRVNHLKFLCDGVERVQDRLTNIESQLSRLDLTSPILEQDFSCSALRRGQHSTDSQSLNEDDDNDHTEDNDNERENDQERFWLEDDDLHVFRNHVDVVDRYHGPSSLFANCNRFQKRALAVGNTESSDNSLRSMLQNLCAVAGTTDPFPSCGDPSSINLLPKQQATTAVNQFFHHLDCTTDIFVQSNLVANLDRVYSQPARLGDDAWATCFKAIALIVLGKEISSRTSNALFGDFAGSFLPSRAALVSFSLLTTPRLINVQTLILLSIAAQQFDPPGWTELIFAHACMLARTMGLHHAHISPSSDVSTEEMLERSKVIQSLYARDKSLCTTRGCVSWLPSSDCNIVPQLSAAVDRQAPYKVRLQLAMVQDDIYRMTRAGARNTRSTLRTIEHQLEQYEQNFGVFDLQPPVALEFLTTRILALQHGSEPRHTRQAQSDARASCLLLLVARGDQDSRVAETFRSLTRRLGLSNNTRREDPPITEQRTADSLNVLDSFSTSAFFILLEGLLEGEENGGGIEPYDDRELLRRVSACYSSTTGGAQSASYYCKVAWIFDQLLTAVDLAKDDRQNTSESSPPAAPVADTMQTDTTTYPPFLQQQTYGTSRPSKASLQGESTDPSFSLQLPASIIMSWDSFLSSPSSLGPNTFSRKSDSMDKPDNSASDLLGQMLGSSHSIPGCSDDAVQWLTSTSETSRNTRKRPRIHKSSVPDDNSHSSLQSEFSV